MPRGQQGNLGQRGHGSARLMQADTEKYQKSSSSSLFPPQHDLFQRGQSSRWTKDPVKHQSGYKIYNIRNYLNKKGEMGRFCRGR